MFFIKSEDGTSTVEFAIVVPVFLLLFLGTITIGLVLYSKSVLVTAINNGAHHAAYIINDDSMTEDEKLTDIEETIYGTLQHTVSNAGTDIDITIGDEYIVIDASYNFASFVPMTGFLFEDGIIVIEESTRVYRLPPNE